MPGKRIKVELLLGVIAVLVGIGAVGLLLRPDVKPDHTLRSRFGDVLWNHEIHARMQSIGSCTVCHHTENQGVTAPRPCGDCHHRRDNVEAMVLGDLFVKQEEVVYSDDNGPPAREVFHAKCIGCHNAMREGPVVCRDCHRQSFSGDHGLTVWDHRAHARKMDIACVRCHHKDEDASWDGEYRACGVCHEPARVGGLDLTTGIAEHEKMKHGQCAVCHVEVNPEKDDRSCTDCHKGLIVKSGDAEEVPPTLEEAVHRRCLECHVESHPDFERTMPAACSDCHKPDPSMIDDHGLAPIMWSHRRHTAFGDWECDACHHTDFPDEPHMACSSCHGTPLFPEIPAVADVLRTRCLGCHEEKKAGLTTWESFGSGREDLSFYHFEDETGSFWWDHRFHAVGAALSCRDCHHNSIHWDDTPPADNPISVVFTGDALRIQTCRNCHGPEGPVPGSAADGSDAPGLAGVYKKSCIECHQRLGGGPLTWEALFNNDAAGTKGPAGGSDGEGRQ